MKNMRKWMFGAAMAAGALAVAATPAQAARFGIYVGAPAPVAYVPPCPGPGYVWAAGYYTNGYWVPGRWNFAGVRGPAVRGYVGFGHPVYARPEVRGRFRR